MTRAVAVQPQIGELEPGSDQAHASGPERPQYRIREQDDGGAWRGPSETAWTARILRGARPPKPSTGLPDEASATRR